MIYTLMRNKNFTKSFKKLDPHVQRRIKSWIDEHLVNTTNPRHTGKALTGNLSNFWRYRIGYFSIKPWT